MCFSIPKQVKAIHNNSATMENGLVVKLGNLKASAGDYLLCYGNMAVEKIARKKAESFRNLIHSSF